MKKIFTLVMGAVLALGASSVSARSIVITSPTDFTNNFKAGVGYDTLFIQGDQNLGNKNVIPTSGTYHIIGLLKENGERPTITFESTLSDSQDETRPSVFFENLRMQTTSQADKYFFSGKAEETKPATFYVDSIVFRNCEIVHFGRGIYRCQNWQKDSVDALSGETIKVWQPSGDMNYFEMTNCQVHDGKVNAGKSFALFNFSTPVAEINIQNNSFYDLPYLDGLIAIGSTNEWDAKKPLKFTFNQNTVAVQNVQFNGSGKDKNGPLFDFANYITGESFLQITNNFFIRPTWDNGYVVLKDSTIEAERRILSVAAATVFVDHNVLSDYGLNKAVYGDAQWDISWTQPDTYLDDNFTLEQANFTIDDFRDVDNGDFRIYTGLDVYTKGAIYTGEDYDVTGQTYIGDGNNYTDVPTLRVNFSVEVEGSESAEITGFVAGKKYFTGDVINLVVDTKGALNEFLGWSDNGSKDLERTITLTGDLQLVAKFKEAEYLAIWNLEQLDANNQTFTCPFAPNFAKGDFKEKYSLNYATFDGTQYKDSTDGKPINTRNNKVTSEIKNCLIIHTLLEQAYDLDDPAWDHLWEVEGGVPIKEDTMMTLPKNPDYVYLTMPYVPADAKLTGFVGTDNLSAKILNVEVSEDGTTWTKVGATEVEEQGKWYAINADLSSLAGKTDILVRLIADADAGLIAFSNDLLESWRTSTPKQGSENGKGFLGKWEAGGGDPRPTAFQYEFTFLADIRLIGTATNGIEILRGDKAASADVIFDLMGRRVSNILPGQLYIQGGKKLILK